MQSTEPSGAALLYSLCEIIYLQQQNGTLQNYMASVSCDAKNNTKSVYETSQVSIEILLAYIPLLLHLLTLLFHFCLFYFYLQNTFTSVSLVSYLMSYPFTTGGTVENVNNIANI